MNLPKFNVGEITNEIKPIREPILMWASVNRIAKENIKHPDHLTPIEDTNGGHAEETTTKDSKTVTHRMTSSKNF